MKRIIIYGNDFQYDYIRKEIKEYIISENSLKINKVIIDLLDKEQFRGQKANVAFCLDKNVDEDTYAYLSAATVRLEDNSKGNFTSDKAIICDMEELVSLLKLFE